MKQGWHPDPTGQFELRYWDGLAWTDHVSTAGQASTAPLTTQAANELTDSTETTAGPSVFISYRSADTGEIAIALAEKLRKDLSWHKVYRDKDNLIGGQRWQNSLVEAIQSATSVVALVGQDWAVTAEGRVRLAEPEDPVAYEILHALHSSTTVPVLVGDASPPSVADEPADDGGFGLVAPNLAAPTSVSANIAGAITALFALHAPRLNLDESGEWLGGGYQDVLVGVWAALAQKAEDGVLVVADPGAQVDLDRFVGELQARDEIHTEVLMRFASGAQILSVRELKKLAKQFPDVICLTSDDDTATFTHRVAALQANPKVRTVETLTVAAGLGYLLIADLLAGAGAAVGTGAAGGGAGAVAGGSAAGSGAGASGLMAGGGTAAGSGAGAGGASAAGLGTFAKLAIGIAAGAAAIGGGVALLPDSDPQIAMFESAVAFDLDGLQLTVTSASIEEVDDQALLDEYRIEGNPARVLTLEVDGRALAPQTDPSQYGEEYGFTPIGKFDDGMYIQSAEGVLVELSAGREDPDQPAFRISAQESRSYTYRAQVPPDFDLDGASVIFASDELIRVPLDEAYSQGLAEIDLRASAGIDDLGITVSLGSDEASILVTDVQIARELGVSRLNTSGSGLPEERQVFTEHATFFIESAPAGMMWLHVQWRYQSPSDSGGLRFGASPSVLVDGVRAPTGFTLGQPSIGEDEILFVEYSFLIPTTTSTIEFLDADTRLGSLPLPIVPPEWSSDLMAPELDSSGRVWTGDQVCGAISLDEVRRMLGTDWAYVRGSPGDQWFPGDSDWSRTDCVIAAYYPETSSIWKSVDITASPCNDPCSSTSELFEVVGDDLLVEASIDGNPSTGEPQIPPDRVAAVLRAIREALS